MSRGFSYSVDPLFYLSSFYFWRTPAAKSSGCFLSLGVIVTYLRIYGYRLICPFGTEYPFLSYCHQAKIPVDCRNNASIMAGAT